MCGHSHHDSHIACIQTDADPSLAKACLMLARRVCVQIESTLAYAFLIGIDID